MDAVYNYFKKFFKNRNVEQISDTEIRVERYKIKIDTSYNPALCWIENKNKTFVRGSPTTVCIWVMWNLKHKKL